MTEPMCSRDANSSYEEGESISSSSTSSTSESIIDNNSELMDNLRLEDTNSTTHASVLSVDPLVVDQSSLVMTPKVSNKYY